MSEEIVYKLIGPHLFITNKSTFPVKKIESKHHVNFLS